MKFSNEQAASLGLVVGGKSGTALVNTVQGFEGRRIYVDGGSKKLGLAGPLIHLSGFTPDEVVALNGALNTHNEYSPRVTGFLGLTPANLAAAAKVVREETSPAYTPYAKKEAKVIDMAAIFAAASKAEEPEGEEQAS